MRKLIAILGIAVTATLAAPLARAVQPDEVMADPAKEARARELSRELRCMVCQNQSIDDSDATLAKDLRLLVRERIAAGDSNKQVLDYLVARYGEFVLLKPRFETHTLILWLLPPLVLIGGGIGLWLHVRRRGRDAARRARLVRAVRLRIRPGRCLRDLPVLDGDVRDHRVVQPGQSDPPCGRRRPQGAPPPDPRDARDAALAAAPPRADGASCGRPRRACAGPARCSCRTCRSASAS